jgi:quercetin dioxygenase-like cupin family protein
MAKIRFCKYADVPLVQPKGNGSLSSRMLHPGAEDELQLVEVNLSPGTIAESHAHELSEIIFVLDGQLRFGATVLNPGDSVQIAGMTLYGFEAGPEGVRYLNFRPRQDRTFYKREELTEFKKLDPAAQAEMRARLIEVRQKEFGYRD